jgi:hypothetical protein
MFLPEKPRLSMSVALAHGLLNSSPGGHADE